MNLCEGLLLPSVLPITSILVCLMAVLLTLVAQAYEKSTLDSKYMSIGDESWTFLWMGDTPNSCVIRVHNKGGECLCSSPSKV
jgi:hypothetical protein